MTTLRDTFLAAKTAKDIVFRANINVYGARQVREEVGHHLSKAKAFLQHPDHSRADTKYDNLHVLALPDIALPTTFIQQKDAHETALKGGSEKPFSKPWRTSSRL